MNQKVITGTLVLVAPEAASVSELHEAIDQAATVHAGPVIVLPHGWAAFPVETIRAQLNEIEMSAVQTVQRIGASRPPPPPPPPG